MSSTSPLLPLRGLHAANAPRPASFSERSSASIRKVWPFAASFAAGQADLGDGALVAASCVSMKRMSTLETSHPSPDGFVT